MSSSALDAQLGRPPGRGWPPRQPCLDDLHVAAGTFLSNVLTHLEAGSKSASEAFQEAKELLRQETAASQCHHLLRALKAAVPGALPQACAEAASTAASLCLSPPLRITMGSQASSSAILDAAACSGSDNAQAHCGPSTSTTRASTHIKRLHRRHVLRQRTSACIRNVRIVASNAISTTATAFSAGQVQSTAESSSHAASSTSASTHAPAAMPADVAAQASSASHLGPSKLTQQQDTACSSRNQERALTAATPSTGGYKPSQQRPAPGTLSELINTKVARLAPLVLKMRKVLCAGPQVQDACAAMCRPVRKSGQPISTTMATSDRQQHWPGAVLKSLPAMATGAQQGGKEQKRVLSERQAGVMAWHKEAEAEAQRRREEAMRQRLAALKNSDMGAYLAMVRSTKNSRLEELLKQTDACLKSLAAKLHKASAKAHGSKGGKAPNEQEDASANGAEGHVSVDGVLQSSLEWGRLAQRLQADIPEQPQMLQGELREYQMQGLRWMVALHDNGLNGILADDMGLGKTVQVISLLAYFVEVRRQQGPFLIAAPASVVANWAAELARWVPELKVVDYRGSADVREALYQKQVSRGRFHVLLTSYDFLMGKADRPRLSRHKWSWIVVDEGHRLKNSECKLNEELKHYNTTSRLLLTGTPLQNKLDELWSLLNFLMPTIFGSADDFDAWFGAPLAALQASKDSRDDSSGSSVGEAAMLSQEEYLLVTNRLHSVLRPFMLRRLKESVASELPGKTEILLTCPMSAYQQALTGLVRQRLEGGQEAGPASINNTVMELRIICNHPLISRLHPAFCEDLLPPHPLPPVLRLSGKVELLDRILLRLSARGHRCLLFCTMTRALDMLEEYLEWRGWEFLRMDGNTSSADRGELVQRFNDPKCSAFLFLLSIRAGGVGLNLQAADTVIMYDTDWNPQIDLQAQARAHRIGQKSHVLVLRLQTADSIEGHVAAVAAQKRRFADSSITGGFFDGKTSAEERRSYLLGVLQNTGTNSDAGTSTSSSSAAELSDAALDRLVARSDDELKLLEADTARRAVSQQAPAAGAAGAASAEPAAERPGESVAEASASIEPMVVDAAGQGAHVQTSPAAPAAASALAAAGRLVSPDECAQLIQAAVQAAAPKRKEEPELLGRGVRRAASGPQGSSSNTQQQRKKARTGQGPADERHASGKQAAPAQKRSTANGQQQQKNQQEEEEKDEEGAAQLKARLEGRAAGTAAKAGDDLGQQAQDQPNAGKAGSSSAHMEVQSEPAGQSNSGAAVQAHEAPIDAVKQQMQGPKKRGRPPKVKVPSVAQACNEGAAAVEPADSPTATRQNKKGRWSST